MLRCSMWCAAAQHSTVRSAAQHNAQRNAAQCSAAQHSTTRSAVRGGLTHQLERRHGLHHGAGLRAAVRRPSAEHLVCAEQRVGLALACRHTYIDTYMHTHTHTHTRSAVQTVVGLVTAVKPKP
jgi:hypothetical protein